MMCNISGDLWTSKYWSYDSVPGGDLGGTQFAEHIADILNRICWGLDGQWTLYLLWEICCNSGTEHVLFPQLALIRFLARSPTRFDEIVGRGSLQVIGGPLCRNVSALEIRKVSAIVPHRSHLESPLALEIMMCTKNICCRL